MLHLGTFEQAAGEAPGEVAASEQSRRVGAPATAGAQSVPAVTKAASTDIDFDLPPDSATTRANPSAQPSIQFDRAVAKRRLMLKTYQILGLSLLGLMAATVVVGQLNYTDLYGSHGGRSGNYLVPTMVSAYATTGAFIATASFGIFAPTPTKK